MRTPFARLVACALVLCAALVACDDDPMRPEDDRFALDVMVRTPDGQPVAGLDVVLWNLSPSLASLLQDSLPRRRAATSVHFVTPQRCVCTLSVFDLEGRLLQTPIDGVTLEAGEHAVTLGPGLPNTAGVQVFRYELRAVDADNGAVLFEDTKSMTLIEIDPTRLDPGKTDASGRYYTSDRTLVPSLYDLGPMPATDESGSPMRSFELGDTLIVHVRDDLGQFVRREFPIADRTMTLDVTWADLRSLPDDTRSAEALGARAPALASSIEPLGRRSDGGDLPPLEFRLEQNAPNPFN